MCEPLAFADPDPLFKRRFIDPLVIALPVSAPPNTNIIAPATLPVIYRLKD